MKLHSLSLERWPERLLGGKYHLVEARASGAFGTVFQAHQFFGRHLVRPVAIKVSHQTGLTEATAGNLFSDALILARLLADNDHPGRRHLVQIHDLGLLPEWDNRAFLVMEYVDGFPLLSHIKAAGRIGVASGLRYIREICAALALIHAQGAVHRDLKPDNVLVDRRGVVRLVDFGLAAFADPRLGFVPGSMGTFTYMAPETLFGRSTPAADVYSLGLLMLELFTGGGPHLRVTWPELDGRDRSREHYRLKQALRFEPPSAVQNEIRYDHPWLDPLILRCLELDPARRFTDGGRLAEALETCLAGGELPPPEPPPATASPSSGSGAGGEESSSPAAVSDEVVRAMRRLLARGAYDQVIDRLDVYRPAEWAVVDSRAARGLRLLGQAYLGRRDLAAARDCLAQLRTAQKEHPVLAVQDHAAVLSDLLRCCRTLGNAELAGLCQAEAHQLLSS